MVFEWFSRCLADGFHGLAPGNGGSKATCEEVSVFFVFKKNHFGVVFDCGFLAFLDVLSVFGQTSWFGFGLKPLRHL